MKYKITVIVPIFGEGLINIARDAVNSALLQSGNYACELIVSNNGGNEKIRNFFTSDDYKDKVKYIEPISYLSMSKHFEWASKFAAGEYMMILPPRRMLKQGAFIKLIETMDLNEDCEICCGCFEEWVEESGRLFLSRSSSVEGVIGTNLLIDKFLCGSYSSRGEFWSTHPTSMNGVVRTRFVNDLRKKYSSSYFGEMFPDVSSGFKALLNSRNIYLISSPIFVITNRSVSTGNKQIMSFNHEYFNELGDAGKYRHLPKNLADSVYCGVIEDFNRQKNEWILINSSDNKSLEISPFFLKEAAFEYFLKLFNNPLNLTNLKRVWMAVQTFNQMGISYFDIFRKFIIGAVATIYLHSPKTLKKTLLVLRGKSIKYKNVYVAAGFHRET
ncbi:MAG: hypothetical protein Q7K13_09505 [Polynucleobacter sp.]|uniref:hypothetical protein n=1 Tax=Polynucleobacter sp. TaxID=2029855 RepID=UPI00271C6AC2|nr:hypothetical protein [Polynucleobacter sp.]MDO8714691.1 hypothetical protein [Polynucleobacter sp.]